MSTTSTSSLAASIFLSIALLAVPLAIAAEHEWANTWDNRLYSPLFREEPNRHTPLITAGTYLPPAITSDTTYTAADSPLILTGTTHIPAGVHVTVESDVKVVAHEFAGFQVDGALRAAGTASAPVIFTTNEVHPDNQNWNGLMVSRGGTLELAHVLIEHASPALSCLPGSTLTGMDVTTRDGLVGLYTESAACALTQSRLQALQYGVVARGVETHVTETDISAGKEDIYVRPF